MNLKTVDAEELAQEISRHRDLYYNNESEISDADFDDMVDRLREIDPLNPVLSLVGAPTSSSFAKFNHKVPMLSLDKVNTIDELGKWAITHGHKDGYVVMDKMDGISLSLHYENGELVRAVTRGDGTKGDDVTVNACCILDIPQRLPSPETIEVRGEAYCKKSVFKAFNESVGGKYANPRNFAAGTMRQLDPSEVAKRGLSFKAYKLIGYDDRISTMSGLLECLRHDLGFKVVTYRQASNSHTLLRRVESTPEDIANWRNGLDYEVDGYVIMPDLLSIQKYLSNNFTTANHAIAFKFPPEVRTTTLIDVNWTVGKSGIVTPVGVFEPVNIGGVTVDHVNLCNLDEIERLGVKMYDMCQIERRGDVIPKVVSAKRGPTVMPFSHDIIPPTGCPSCNTVLTRDTAYLQCPSKTTCPAQIGGTIISCCSALDIKGLGDAGVQTLIEAGAVKDFADLVSLHRTSFEAYLGVNGLKLWESIQKHKTVDIKKFYYLLNIYSVGERASASIAEIYPDPIEFLEGDFGSTRLRKLQAIVGFAMAEKIHEWLKSQINTRYLRKLVAVLTITRAEVKSSILKHKTFVVTGTFSKPRKVIEQLIEENGGKVGSSVSSNTSYLVAGDGGGSKFSKAVSLKVPVITETILMGIIG